MLLADVGGIDNRFADAASRMRDLMKRNINVIAQSPAVIQMTAELDRTSRDGGFAAALLSTFFAPTRSLTICNAGLPPPLYFKSAGKQWTALKAGLCEFPPALDYSGTVDPREYQRFKLKLDVGDMFFCYSNALTECRQSNGRLIGVEGIGRLVHELSESTDIKTALRNLVTGIRDEHQDNLCGEDATVILCKVTQSRVAMRDNFLAPFRILRGASDRTSF